MFVLSSRLTLWPAELIRAHLAEFGIVAPVGRKGVEALLDVVANPTDKRVPVIARACLAALGAQLRRLKEQILEFDRMIMTWHRSHEASRRLDAIPGVPSAGHGPGRQHR
jgi:transposase